MCLYGHANCVPINVIEKLRGRGRERQRIKDRAGGSHGGMYNGEMAHTQAGMITVIREILGVRRPTRDR